MAADHRDPLGTALGALRPDVDLLPLASAADVRARGDQRTRHRRAALGATTVAAVAVLVVGTATVADPPRRAVPPAGGTSTSPATPTPTLLRTSGAPTASVGPPTAPRPTVTVKPVGVGHVAAAYFLPGRLWQGPDLNNGRRIESITPKDYEGSIQRFECDPDTDLTGDVAFVQAAEPKGMFVGTQKVRLFANLAKAEVFAADVAAAMPGCQARLRAQAKADAAAAPPGETAPTPNAEVVEDRHSRVVDATGSVRLFRTTTDYGTGAGSALIQWVAVAREGSAVTLLDVSQFEESSVTFGALRRVAGEARAQMAAAAN